MPRRKDQILKLATELFSRDGYDKVTVKQLADGCGITEPAIYRHFASKEALFSEVLESLSARINCDDLFAKLEGEVEIEVILSGIAYHVIEFHSENADLYRLLLYSVLAGHERARHVFEIVRGTYVRFLIKQLNRLCHQGTILEKNNEITARCFVGMVFDCAQGRTLFKGLQGRSYRASDVIDNNVPIYARGLKA